MDNDERKEERGNAHIYNNTPLPQHSEALVPSLVGREDTFFRHALAGSASVPRGRSLRPGGVRSPTRILQGALVASAAPGRDRLRRQRQRAPTCVALRLGSGSLGVWGAALGKFCVSLFHACCAVGLREADFGRYSVSYQTVAETWRRRGRRRPRPAMPAPRRRRVSSTPPLPGSSPSPPPNPSRSR